MKNIFRIARHEVSTLFYSPVAWLILIIFPIQAAIDLTKVMQMIGRAQRMGQVFTNITEKIFAGPYGFYGGVKNTLYLYIPLLTMGLVSREIHSGSIKLLLSSPIKVRDIVLGKYLAIITYALILVGILGVFGLMSAYAITNVDYKMLISATLSLYLLICAYAAIGLFMSCLTSYQVVAAISTLAVLGVLNFIGGLFQGIDLVRHVTYFLSISGRTEQFINGLISTEDVIYFLLVIILFLSLTAFKLQSDREAKPFWVKFARYAMLIAGCCLVGYISSRPSLTGYIDMTINHSRTLHKNSIALIKKMDKPLKITTYVNILDGNYYLGKPEVKSADEKSFMPYRRFIPDLQMDFVYYYDKAKNPSLYKNNRGLSEQAIARKVADIQGLDFTDILPPAQIRKMVDLHTEENRLVRQLTYGDQKTFLRYFGDIKIYPEEQEITAALKRLVDPGKIPSFTFLTGNNERSVYREGDADYKTATKELSFRYSLINQGFNIDTVNLQSQSISAKTSILCIADPKIQFTKSDLDKINQYIAKGGNLIINAEPGHLQALNPVLATLGVKLGADTTREKNRDFAPEFILASFTKEAGTISTKYKLWKDENDIVSMPGVTSLSYDKTKGFDEVPILADKWDRPLALTLTRNINNKQQRIYVSGDADFMSSIELYRGRPTTMNFYLMTEIFSWLNYGEFPVDVYKPDLKDVVTNDVSGLFIIRLFFFGIFPVSVLIWGSTLLVYRKKR
jgi:ABC-2 type transport system permease protein